MRQIIPFKKELLFKTNVSEITSISLEHNVSIKEEDLISGEFIITGDYKMTDASINREKFSFNLPFDIALDSRYDTNSIIVDIDNFYYEVINNEILMVNIDLFVDGKKYEETKEDEEKMPEIRFVPNERKNNIEEPFIKPITFHNKEELDSEELDLSINYMKNSIPKIDEIELENDIDFNIFQEIDNSDTYITYHVYIVKEGDTIDSIMENYGVKKDSLTLCNDIENIRVGTKLIIPYE